MSSRQESQIQRNGVFIVLPGEAEPLAGADGDEALQLYRLVIFEIPFKKHG